MLPSEVLAEWQDRLSRVRYKPGTRFEAFWHGDPRNIVLRVTVRVLDADTLARTIDVSFTEPLFLLQAEQALSVPDLFHRMIFDVVRRVEEHEAAEFFQVDGVKPYDPHKEKERVGV